MMWKRPSLRRAGSVRGAPRPGVLARIGAPPLIALTCSLGLLALLFCALFVPGFVKPADADTTSSTQAVPADIAPGQPTTTDPAPIQLVPAEPSPGRQLVTLPWGNRVGQVG